MICTMKFVVRISLVACSVSVLYSLSLLQVALYRQASSRDAIGKSIKLKNRSIAKIEKGVDDTKTDHPLTQSHQQKVAPSSTQILKSDPETPIEGHNCSNITVNDTRVDWGPCRDVVINASTTETVCVYRPLSGDRRLDQLVDSPCPVDLPLLDNYRSPCWYEELPADFKKRYRLMPQMFRDQAKRSFQQVSPVLEKRTKDAKSPWRLRCLPLVYIIGVAKSGTSDLFSLLLRHPHIVQGATKEPFFWDSTRWNRGAQIEDFLNLFDEASESIRQTTTSNGQQPKGYHPMVTVDASVNTLFNFDGSLKLKANNDTMPPRYIAAHLIQNLTPRTDLKVIVIVREPVERLFSSYVFFNTVTNPSNISAEEFDAIATECVKRMQNCFKSQPMRECLYRKRVTRTRKMVDVNAGIYYGYIADWIKVFPRMRVIRIEDYKQNRERIFQDLVQYIGLKYVELQVNQSSVIAKGPARSFEIWNSTRKMLKEFYQPFNGMLAVLLKNDRYRYES